MNLNISAKKMIQIICVAASIMLVIALLLCIFVSTLSTGDFFPMFTGIVLSASVNIIKVFMLNYQVLRLSVMTEQNKARMYAGGQSLLRLVLTAAGLLAAHAVDFAIAKNAGHNVTSLFATYNISHFTLYAAIISAFTWHIAAFGLRYANLNEELAINTSPQSAGGAKADDDTESGETSDADGGTGISDKDGSKTADDEDDLYSTE